MACRNLPTLLVFRFKSARDASRFKDIMRSNESNRREFLTRLGMGAVVVGAVGALAACGKKEGEAGGECSDVSALSDADKTSRTANSYVEKSVEAGKICSGCTLFVAAAAGAKCASCKVVKGPIVPEGYCKLFAAAPKPA